MDRRYRKKGKVIALVAVRAAVRAGCDLMRASPHTTMNIASILRHWFTLLATLLTGWLVLPAEQQAELSKALGDLVGPLVIILTLVVTAGWRIALAWGQKFFRRGAGELGKENGETGGGGASGSGSALLLLLACTAGVLGGLPSCSMGEYPISGSVTFYDQASGAKAGLTFYPPARKVRAEK
jgi:hypothetical protein